MDNTFHLAMVKSGISQVELAAQVGVHPSTISRVVCGWVVPDDEVQAAIREALAPHGRRLRFGYRLPPKRRLRRTSRDRLSEKGGNAKTNIDVRING